MSTAAKQLKGRAARLARLMPSGPSTAARAPFVLLVVLLLGGGLITLLLLNSALNQGSFKLSELKKQTTELTDEEQALQRDVDSYSAPGALERRARELGMVPGGSPAFLDPDGRVRGVPGRVTTQLSRDPSPMAARRPVAGPPAAAHAPSAAVPPSAPVSASPSAQARPSAPSAPAPSVPAPAAPAPSVSAPASPAPPSVSARPQQAAPRPPSTPVPPKAPAPSRTPAKPIPTTPGR